MNKPTQKRLCFPRVPREEWKGRGWFPWQGSQDMVPKDAGLAKKLGIKPNSSVLIMCGSYGDWARALSQFCKVKYTDLSKGMTKHAAKDSAKVLSFTSRPAELLVRRPMRYDWSFLFEPFPIQEGMTFVFMRSLLNNRGCKVVVSAGYNHTAFDYYLKAVSKIYKARITKQRQAIIEGTFLSGEGHTRSVYIISLHTNKYAREKAWLDLRLLRELNTATKRQRELHLQELCKKLNVSVENLEKSMRRLSKLAYLAEEKGFVGIGD